MITRQALIPLVNAASTTHSIRYFKVYDGASSAVTTGWKIFIGTSGSVAINGGAGGSGYVEVTEFP